MESIYSPRQWRDPALVRVICRGVGIYAIVYGFGAAIGFANNFGIEWIWMKRAQQAGATVTWDMDARRLLAFVGLPIFYLAAGAILLFGASVIARIFEPRNTLPGA